MHATCCMRVSNMLEKFGYVAKTQYANVSHVHLQHVVATCYANMLHVRLQHVYMHVICIRHVATTRYANMLYARVQHVRNTLHACHAHLDATRNAKLQGLVRSSASIFAKLQGLFWTCPYDFVYNHLTKRSKKRIDRFHHAHAT